MQSDSHSTKHEQALAKANVENTALQRQVAQLKETIASQEKKISSMGKNSLVLERSRRGEINSLSAEIEELRKGSTSSLMYERIEEILTLKDQLRDSQDQRVKLEKKFDNLKKSFDLAREHLQDMTSRNEQLSKGLHDKEACAYYAITNSGAAERMKDDLIVALKKDREEKDDKEKEKYQKEIVELQKTFTNQCHTISRLEQDLEASRYSSSQLEHSLKGVADLQKNLTEQSNLAKSLKEQLDNRDVQLKGKEILISQLRDESKTSTEKLAKKCLEFNELEKSFVEKSYFIDNMEKHLKSKSTIIENLTEEVKKLNDCFAAGQQGHKAIKDELDFAKSGMEGLHQQIKELKTELSAKDDTIATLTKEVQKHKDAWSTQHQVNGVTRVFSDFGAAAAKDLRSQLDDANKRVHLAIAQRTAFQKAFETERDEHAALKKSLVKTPEQLKQEHKDAQNIVDLVMDRERLRNEVKDLQKKLELAIQEKHTTPSSESSVDKIVETPNEILQGMKKMTAENLKKIREGEIQIKELESRLAAQSKTIAGYQQTCGDYASEIYALKGQMESQATEIKDFKEFLADERALLKNAKAKIRKLKKRRKALRKTIDSLPNQDTAAIFRSLLRSCL